MAVPSDMAFYNLVNGITEPEPDTPMGDELTYLRTSQNKSLLRHG